MRTRPATCCFLLLAMCCASGAAPAAGPAAESSGESPAGPEIRTLRPVAHPSDPPAGGGPDRGLEARGRCHDSLPRTAVVELRWQSSESEFPPPRIEATQFRDGFEKNRFETTDRLAPGAVSVLIEGPEPGIHYYWRVVRDGDAGSVSSPIARFEVPVCPWDPPAGTEGGER